MAIRNTAECIRVFIDDGPEILRKVLECSIVRRTDMRVDVTVMRGYRWQAHAMPAWLIPAHTGYQGRALYLHQHCLFLSDIWDLWTQPEQQGNMGRGALWCGHRDIEPNPRVLLLDCEKAQGRWPFDLEQVRAFFTTFPDDTAGFLSAALAECLPGHLPGVDWDSISPATRVCCYGELPPWLDPGHPHALKWQMELSVALNCDFVNVDLLKQSLAEGVLHPDYARFTPKTQKKQNKLNTPSHYLLKQELEKRGVA